MNIKIEKIRALIRKAKADYEVRICDIYISNGLIVSLSECPIGFVADKIIDGSDKLAFPGLVNCHTHAYMTCFRCFADDLPFSEWLFGRIEPNEDKLTFEDAYYSSLAACAEMIETGTTSFLEMHMFKGMVAKAAKKSGIRCVLSRGLVGNGNDERGSVRLAQAFDEMKEFKDVPTLSFMLGPHAIYSTDEEYLKIVSEAAKRNDLPIHIHLSESLFEVSECVKKRGKTPVQYLESIGLFENKVIAAHCTNLTDDDIAVLAKHNVNVSLCMRSNMKLGNGIPQVKKMLDSGINICLGTDSAASNNTLNLFSEIAMMSLVPKGLAYSSTCINAGEILDMVTYNGAQALGINSGSLDVGKNADITIFKLQSLSLAPYNDLVSALCYSANGSETDTVIINGNIVMEDKKLCNIDKKEVITNLNKIVERLALIK